MRVSDGCSPDGEERWQTHRLYRRVLVSVFLFSIPILKCHNAQSVGTVDEKGVDKGDV